MKPSPNYALAHLLLPKLMTAEPQGMDPRLKPTLAEADQVLAGMWRAAQQMAGPGLPVPPVCARVKAGDEQGLVICFPPPMQTPDAYYALCIRQEGRWRYLTFEKTVEDGGAVLGGWTADQKHENYGHHEGATSLDAFLSACEGLIGSELERVEGPREVVLKGTITGGSVGTSGFRPTNSWVYVAIAAALIGGALFLLAS